MKQTKLTKKSKGKDKTVQAQLIIPPCYLTTQRHPCFGGGAVIVVRLLVVLDVCLNCTQVNLHLQHWPPTCASHFLFMPIYKDNKQCTGNYINYNNLIRMMGIIMMRTMCFVKSNIFQTRMTSCSLYMHLQHTVLLGLFPGNTLIRQSKRRGGKKSMLFGIQRENLSLFKSKLTLAKTTTNCCGLQ